MNIEKLFFNNTIIFLCIIMEIAIYSSFLCFYLTLLCKMITFNLTNKSCKRSYLVQSGKLRLILFCLDIKIVTYSLCLRIIFYSADFFFFF